MGRAGTGAKAGVVSGVVYGAVSAVSTYVSMVAMKDQVMSAIEKGLPPDPSITAEQVYEFVLLFGAVFMVIIGVVVGVILGAVYGWAYEKIPGGNSVYKGLIIGVIFWVIFDVLLGIGSLQYGSFYTTLNLVWSLVISLVFGALLGIFYNNFTPKAVS